MVLFRFPRLPDINRGVQEFRSVPGAVLLDVRSPGEYRQGRIPGSTNVPLQDLDEVAFFVEDKAAPLFLYCHSGNRSRQAAQELQAMGYTNVNNIGGIETYSGKLES